MSNDKLAQFSNQKYLNLESYRRNGQGVRTPLWFVEDNGVLYFYTVADSYKVKRLGANPRVRVVPCDMRGKVKGSWVEATARRLGAEESRHANELLDRKYGFIKRIMNFMSRIQGRERAAFAIHLD
jgi:PPOX class probable F420-dependent enzyme